MIETGKILQQRYLIDKQIGQGGMGAVYVATDQRFGSTVAIKETLCMDDNYRKAIEREARLLNSLKHGALPRVTDHFLEDNGQFLVMEYIPGNDLFEILEEKGEPFPVDKVQDWADQLLDALEFLHTQSLPVIHRDIKPQNLKITPQGRIVLLDFGLAKGNPTDAGVQTAAKSIFGYSRNYASLEQIQGTGTDPRSDLYSLAATLYHLVTGQTPEDALTRAMAVLSKRPDPLVPANAIRPEVPAGFAGILHAAMDLDAAGRPSSAAEMREMLKNQDAYAYLAADAASAATVANVELGSQKTRLMPGATNHAAGQAAVATEILPAYISQETSVRGPLTGGTTDPEAARPARRTGKALAYAGLGALLLAGGLGAGAYILDPSLSGGRGNSGEQPREVQQVTTTSTEAAPPANAGTGVPPATADTAAVPAATETRPEASPGAKQPVAKSTKPAPAANRATGAGVGLSDEDLNLDGKTIYVGNLKIKDGKIETPTTVIDENGFTPKRPVPPLVVGPDGIPDAKYLTPAQRRQLQELRRRGLFPPVKRVRPQSNNDQ